MSLRLATRGGLRPRTSCVARLKLRSPLKVTATCRTPVSPSEQAPRTAPTASGRAFPRRACPAPFLGPRPCRSRRSNGGDRLPGECLVGESAPDDAAQHGQEAVAVVAEALIIPERLLI